MAKIDKTMLGDVLEGAGCPSRFVGVVKEMVDEWNSRDAAAAGYGGGKRGRQPGQSCEAGAHSERLDQKLQIKFDCKTRDDIEELSAYFGVSAAEIVRSAFRVYNWARRQVAGDLDVGAYDAMRGLFIACDIPYALPALGLARRSEQRRGERAEDPPDTGTDCTGGAGHVRTQHEGP